LEAACNDGIVAAKASSDCFLIEADTMFEYSQASSCCSSCHDGLALPAFKDEGSGCVFENETSSRSHRAFKSCCLSQLNDSNDTMNEVDFESTTSTSTSISTSTSTSILVNESTPMITSPSLVSSHGENETIFDDKTLFKAIDNELRKIIEESLIDEITTQIETTTTTTPMVCIPRCHHVCEADDYGNPICTCNSGYRLAEDGFSCQDINECVEETHNCPSGSTCLNMRPGFFCEEPVLEEPVKFSQTD